MSKYFNVVIEKDEDGYLVASVPSLKGCHTQAKIMDELLDRPAGDAEQLITFVKDRPGHDQRYAIDASKIKEELGWEHSVGVADGLRRTAQWYLDNQEWLDQVTSGAYRDYYAAQYQD